jgi:hypothetical protein
MIVMPVLSFMIAVVIVLPAAGVCWAVVVATREEEPVPGFVFVLEDVVEAPAHELEVADGPPVILPAGLAVIPPMIYDPSPVVLITFPTVPHNPLRVLMVLYRLVSAVFA